MEDARIVLQECCPLCGGNRHSELASFPEMQWVTCECGLIYLLSHEPSVAKPQAYEEEYFAGGVYNARWSRRERKSRHQILDVLNHVEPGPLLDIGCSLGYTLQAARGLGLDAAGADVSEFAVATCREHGFDAEVGHLGSMPFASGRFAVVTMKHVLEHTPDPRAALRDVRRLLRPRGGLFVAVPDARYRKAAGNPQKSRFYRPGPKGVHHYIYYTPETLSRLLVEEGFTVARIHPHIVHRHAPMATRAWQRLTAPIRMAGQGLRERLALRKEFWLTAVRSD